MKELSYVMVKPEFANNKKVIRAIQQRLLTGQGAGLELLKADFIQYTEEDAKKHYAEHLNKDFYPHLEKYITSDIAFGMVFHGENAIERIRTIVGSTRNPAEGTIRHDIPKMLGLELRITENVVHASDSIEAAEKEIAIFNEILRRQEQISSIS